MALWHCRVCTTAYAVGLPACPHCRSTSKEEDGMPKITKAGGPSHEGDQPAEAPAPVVEIPTVEVLAEPEPAEAPAPVVEPEPRTRKTTGKAGGRG